MSGNPPLSLYFHIPFCNKKCPYCHFFVLPNKKEYHALLKRGLELELASLKPILQSYEIVSIYFGGGTPSLFGSAPIGELIDRVYDTCQVAPDCEITLEANPEDVTQEMMSAYKETGINRVSLGVQSLVDESLILIGRDHCANKASSAIKETFQAGIENISIDLMYDLPRQSVESFDQTLHSLKSLPISHLSLYNLTIEPHTPFWKKKNTLELPSDEDSFAMLKAAVCSLEALGLKRYEVSAFAKDGFASRHNTGYWTGRPFFGLGPSAFSYYEGSRKRNVAHLKKYVKALETSLSPCDFVETLAYPQNVHERLAIELRLVEGVDLSSFSLPLNTKQKLEKLAKQGYLEKDEKRCKLTDKGFLFYDSVAVELI